MNAQLADAQEDWQKTQLRELMNLSASKIQSAQSEVAEDQAFYTTFCENVLQGLLDESEQRAERAKQQFSQMSEDLSTEEFPGAPKENGE